MTNLRVSHIRADPMNRQDLVELNLLTYNCAIVLCDQVRAGGMQGREGRGGGGKRPIGPACLQLLPAATAQLPSARSATACCLLLLPSSRLPGLLPLIAFLRRHLRGSAVCRPGSTLTRTARMAWTRRQQGTCCGWIAW